MSQREQELQVTCVVCPIGCNVVVRGSGEQVLSVEGNQCKRGDDYARAEFIHPVRTLTSTVKLNGGGEPLLPVRSRAPLPKDQLFDCMAQLRSQVVEAPVSLYDVVIPNICGTGVDIVATADADKIS